MRKPLEAKIALKMNSASHSKSSLTLALGVMPFYETDVA